MSAPSLEAHGRGGLDGGNDVGRSNEGEVGEDDDAYVEQQQRQPVDADGDKWHVVCLWVETDNVEPLLNQCQSDADDVAQ